MSLQKKFELIYKDWYNLIEVISSWTEQNCYLSLNGQWREQVVFKWDDYVFS